MKMKTIIFLYKRYLNFALKKLLYLLEFIQKQKLILFDKILCLYNLNKE